MFPAMSKLHLQRMQGLLEQRMHTKHVRNSEHLEIYNTSDRHCTLPLSVLHTKHNDRMQNGQGFYTLV